MAAPSRPQGEYDPGTRVEDSLVTQGISHHGQARAVRFCRRDDRRADVRKHVDSICGHADAVCDQGLQDRDGQGCVREGRAEGSQGSDEGLEQGEEDQVVQPVPREAGTEVRAQGGRPRAVQEARGKVISGGTPVRLPPPTSGSAAQAPRITVQISLQGQIFVNSNAVTDAALPRTLRDLASRNKDTALLIQADKKAQYARVVFVLDQAKQAGITRVSLDMAPP